VVVEDLGSSNGTFVSGMRAVGSMLAPTGGIIQIGSTILRVEGEVTAIRWPVVEGLACFELWVPIGDGVRSERWAIECVAGGAQKVTEALKPGDHVVVTGTVAQGMTAHRLTLESLARPADGFIWRADI